MLLIEFERTSFHQETLKQILKLNFEAIVGEIDECLMRISWSLINYEALLRVYFRGDRKHLSTGLLSAF